MTAQLTFIGGAVAGYARKAMNNTYITHHPKRAIIEHRIKVINFFDCYGATATKEAFAVSRSTVFNWKHKLKSGYGRLEALAPQSTRPHRRRSRQIDERITDFIIRQRTHHPCLSKDKLAVLIQSSCQQWDISAPSASTVGRILNDLKIQGRLPLNQALSLNGATGRLHERKHRPRLKKQRRNGYRPQTPGDMLQIDTIVKFIDGLKRYVLTAVDYSGRFAFAYGYASPTSTNAADFLLKLQAVAPFTIHRVHHDNGSEFYKHFKLACDQQSIIQLWNYPKRPQHNGMVERLNRSIQDEFINWHLDDLAYDLDGFNHQLMGWLVWYNTERPHYGLKLKTPMQYLLDLLQLTPRESNMLWTDTTS